MERVQRLLSDPHFRDYLRLTEQHEEQRSFCRHNLSHLLDVARIAWILCLERKLEIARPLVYAAALLHDIGRFLQYEDDSKDHAKESALLAAPLLIRHGFSEAEKEAVLQAIKAHRQPPCELADPLSALLAEADDLSRCCFECAAQAECRKFARMPAAQKVHY